MRRILLSIFLVMLFFPVELLADKNNQIQVLFQVFRLSDNVKGKVSPGKDIWTTDDVPSKVKGTVEVFKKGSFTAGEEKLEFKNGKCYWNSKELPMAGPDAVKLSDKMISMIYSPEILLFEHSSGKVMIESKQPIQYFEKQNDGLFELKEMELATGVDLEITEAVEEEDQNKILLTDILMTLRAVEKREYIKGVNLSVGKPILGETKYDFYFRLDPGEDYGILIKPRQGRGTLLLRLRANSLSSGTYMPPVQPTVNQ